MTRRILAVLATLLVGLVAGCGVTAPGGSNVDVDTDQMRAVKATAGIADCPAAQTTNGGLPDQTLQCLGGGRSVDLSTLKGPLLINLWGAYCGPCQEEMPALQAFYKAYGTRIPVLGVDFEDTIPLISLQIAAKRGVTFPLVADPGGDLTQTSLSPGHGLPATFLLTADGQVKLVSKGGMKDEAEVRKAVEAALGEPL